MLIHSFSSQNFGLAVKMIRSSCNKFFVDKGRLNLTKTLKKNNVVEFLVFEGELLGCEFDFLVWCFF